MPTGVRRWKAASESQLRQMSFLVELAADPDILKALHAIDTLCDEAAALRAAAVNEARQQEASWDEIGESLGISRQAAWERFQRTSNVCVVPAAAKNGNR